METTPATTNLVDTRGPRPRSLRLPSYTSEKIRVLGLFLTGIVVLHTAYNLMFSVGSPSPLLWYAETFVHCGLRILAVPFFFVCSGFFLANRDDFPRAWPGEVRKRISSLLVPFVAWSAGWILVMWLLQQVPLLAVHFGRAHIRLSDPLQILDLMTVDPIPHPLWYMRDLFVLTLISPVIVWLLRRLPGIVVYFAVSIAILFSRPALNVREVQDLTFFGIGVVIALHRPVVPLLARPVKWLLLLASLGLMAANCWWIRVNDVESPWLLDTAAVLGLPAIWLLMDDAPRLWRRPSLIWLSEFALFIYVAHAPAIELLRKAAALSLGGHGAALWVIWLGSTVIVVAVSIAVAIALRAHLPSAYSVLTGGRNVDRIARPQVDAVAIAQTPAVPASA